MDASSTALYFLGGRRLIPLIVAHWAANALATLTGVLLPLLAR